MNLKILSNKKRLRESLALMPSDCVQYYDLFCDHGLVGKACLSHYQKPVFFNDKRIHLIDKLRAEVDLAPQHFIVKDARETCLLPNSGVFMLGVGGLLIVECLKRWKEARVENFEKSKFLLGPTYYPVELLHYLGHNGFKILRKGFVFENKRGHELFLVEVSESPQKGTLFDEVFWRSVVEQGFGGLRYLKARMNSLEKIRNPKPFIFDYRNQLKKFLSSQKH